MIRIKEFDKAVNYFRKVISQKNDYRYFFNLAYCEAQLGEQKKALIYFKTALSLNPNDKDSQKAVNTLERNLNIVYGDSAY